MTAEQRQELKRWLRASILDPKGVPLQTGFQEWFQKSRSWIADIPDEVLKEINREVRQELYP